MKIFFIFLFLSISILPSLFSQQIIYTNWHYDLVDTTVKEAQYRKANIPLQLIDLDKKDFVFGTFNFNAGWTVRRMEKKTGKLIWMNARNANYPDSSNKMFVFDNIFLRPDGNVDVLGVKSFGNAYSTGVDGNPVRVVYDIHDGKEKQLIEVKQPSGNKISVAKLGTIGSFVPKTNNKGYYLLGFERASKLHCLSLSGLDTNLVILDTLSYFDECKYDPNNLISVEATTPLSKIKDNLYFMISTWAFKFDTSSYRHYLYKIGLDGKPKMVKNVAKELFYSVGLIFHKVISDGYLVSGVIDTTLKLKYNTPMVTKLDTMGKMIWQIFLKQPQGVDSLDIINSCEDKTRKGYWLMMGSTRKRDCYLYFITYAGKITYLSKVKLPSSNTEPIFPYDLWVLNDGDLHFSYRYWRGYKSGSFSKNWGLSMIEAQVLDNLLKISATSERETQRAVFIHPNPANQTMRIQFDKSITGVVQVLNNSGQWLKTEVTTNTELFDLNTADLTNGVYFIQILEKGKLVTTQKVVIQH